MKKLLLYLPLLASTGIQSGAASAKVTQQSPLIQATLAPQPQGQNPVLTNEQLIIALIAAGKDPEVIANLGKVIEEIKNQQSQPALHRAVTTASNGGIKVLNILTAFNEKEQTFGETLTESAIFCAAGLASSWVIGQAEAQIKTISSDRLRNSAAFSSAKVALATQIFTAVMALKATISGIGLGTKWYRKMSTTGLQEFIDNGDIQAEIPVTQESGAEVK